LIKNILGARPTLGPTQVHVQRISALLPGLKRTGRCPPSRAEVKERVETYFYSPSEP